MCAFKGMTAEIKRAELEAARLADLMLDRGDAEGRRVWRGIRRAIEALQARPAGKPNWDSRRRTRSRYDPSGKHAPAGSENERGA
jgi:hypothetical protein